MSDDERTLKELDIARAKLEALESMESSEPFYSDFKCSIPVLDSKEHIEKFIWTQPRTEEQVKLETVTEATLSSHGKSSA
jgi:hypothetical protein